MKRLLIMTVMAIGLAACSSEGAVNQTTKEVAHVSEYQFKDGVAEIEDVRVAILDTRVIQPGEEGNEYGDESIFAVRYEVTNKSDKEIMPGMAWIAIFDAVQEDDNAVKSLEVGSMPYREHLDTQFNEIKKDGTIESSIAYKMSDDVTPVKLIASKGVGGEVIGEQEYEVK